MRYVITFEDYDCGAVSFVIDAPYIGHAIMEAKEKANENAHNYSDEDVLSVVRI